MVKKKTMTLNITENEMKILEKESRELGITKATFVRQALRFYQQHLHPELILPIKTNGINQCDGCSQGLSIVKGLHVDSRRKPVMVCTKKLYT